MAHINDFTSVPINTCYISIDSNVHQDKPGAICSGKNTRGGLSLGNRLEDGLCHLARVGGYLLLDTYAVRVARPSLKITPSMQPLLKSDSKTKDAMHDAF